MPDFRPVSRRAYCLGNQWRAVVEITEGDSRREVEAQVDLDPTDGTANPRIQYNNGTEVVSADVNDAFVTAFRALRDTTASPADQNAICGNAPAAPRSPITLGYILDMTGGTNISHPGRTFPSWTSGFYAADTFFNPNGELVLNWKPIPEFTATLDIGVGQNFTATQPTGVLKHGYPFDLPQFFLEYCPTIASGLSLCLGTGRRGDRSGSGIEGASANARDFALLSTTFSISPYFQFVYGEVGLVHSNFSIRAALGPGPDRFFPDNNSAPYGMVNATLTFPSFLLNADWQGGPDQDGDNSRWQHYMDLGMVFGPNGPFRGMIYGMYGTADTPTGRQNWGGANGSLRIRPTGAPVGVNLRFGYIHDDGFKTGSPVPIDALQADGGLTVYAADDALQFRLQGGVIGMVDGSHPFYGEAVVPRVMLQIVYSGSTNFGVTSPF